MHTVRLYSPLLGQLFASRSWPVGTPRAKMHRWIDRQDNRYGAILRREWT